MKIKITIERDGWDWHIEPQEDCPDGVDIVYHQINKPPKRICVGDLQDAAALARGILAYVEFARKDTDIHTYG